MASSQAQLRAMMRKHATSSASTSNQKLSAAQLRQMKKQRKQMRPPPANLPQRGHDDQPEPRTVQQPTASLPAGFFDSSSAPSMKHRTGSSPTPVPHWFNEHPTVAASPLQEDEVKQPLVSAGPVASKQTASIPAGFFDDTKEDDKVRAVDIKAKQREKEADEWAEFSAFKAEVEAAEAEREAAEDSTYKQRQARADVEAELWRMRVADIKQRTLERRGGKRPRHEGETATAEKSGSAQDDEPDEGWSLLTVAPALPAAIDVQRAAKVFAANSGSGAAAQDITHGQARPAASVGVDSGDDEEDYLQGVGLDWRSKGR